MSPHRRRAPGSPPFTELVQVAAAAVRVFSTSQGGSATFSEPITKKRLSVPAPTTSNVAKTAPHGFPRAPSATTTCSPV